MVYNFMCGFEAQSLPLGYFGQFHVRTCQTCSNVIIPVKIDLRRFVSMHFLFREYPLRIQIKLVYNDLYGLDVFSHPQIRLHVPYMTLYLSVYGTRFSGSNVLLQQWLSFCRVALLFFCTLPPNRCLWFLMHPMLLPKV